MTVIAEATPTTEPTPATDAHRNSFCGIPTPTLVYAGPQTKAEFDALALPGDVHDWKPDEVQTLIRNDGRQWEHRCHSKVLEANGVMVIFQWFDRRPVETAAPVEA